MSAALWAWACDAYARPGVKQACLTLQDEAGLDVDVMLWIAWLASAGRRPADGALADALAISAEHQDRAVKPLRAARRASDGAQKAKILEAELAAERAELDALAALADAPAPEGARLADTLARYARAAGAQTADTGPLARALLA